MELATLVYLLAFCIGLCFLIGLVLKKKVVKTWGHAIFGFISLLVPVFNVMMAGILVWIVVGPYLAKLLTTPIFEESR